MESKQAVLYWGMKIGVFNLKGALRFVAYTFVFISLCHQPTLDKLNPQFENAKHLFKIIMPELVSMETYLVLCTHCKPMVRDLVSRAIYEDH